MVFDEDRIIIGIFEKFGVNVFYDIIMIDIFYYMFFKFIECIILRMDFNVIIDIGWLGYRY